MLVSLYQVVLPVSDIDQAETFYIQSLGMSGRRMGPGEYHFDCGDVVLCCRHPGPDSDPAQVSRSPQQAYLAVEDLDAVFEKAQTAGCGALDQEMRSHPWGGRSFAAQDPFGNTIVFVDERTMQREASERISGGPDGTLTTGLVVTLKRASEDHLVASVSKIFDNELWLKLEDFPEGAPLTPGDPVQLRYYDATGAFAADSEVIQISPTDNRYVALSIPQEANEVKKRAAPRVRLVIPISFSFVGSPESGEVSEEVFNARSHDISTGGIRLETEAQLTKGDEVKMTLVLPESQPVAVTAKVMATQRAKVQGTTMTSAGLRFTDIQLEDQITLLHFLIKDEEEPEESPQVGGQEVETPAIAEAPSETVGVAASTEKTVDAREEPPKLPPIVQSSVIFDAGKMVLILLNGFHEVIVVRSVMVSTEVGAPTPLLDEPMQLSPGQSERLDITEKLLTLFNAEGMEASDTHLYIFVSLDPEPPAQPAPTSYSVRFENGSFTHFSAAD